MPDPAPDWLVPGPPPPAFATEERCVITELLNVAACPRVSLALAEVAPGVTTRLHAVRDTVECYVIVRGRGVAEVGGVAAAVGPGDRVVIPPGVAQRISNTGDMTLAFHCVCAPRFRQANYVDLDD
jgi:mannose-6-phosphate isomerase-like protein (cupin superfamily)